MNVAELTVSELKTPLLVVAGLTFEHPFNRRLRSLAMTTSLLNPPQPNADEARPSWMSAVSTDRETPPGRVMIVDDDPVIVKTIEFHLNQAGYEEFVTTEDSREAMELIRSHQPDVVILDVIMPHLSGLDVLHQIRSDSDLAHLPVLIVTARTDDQTKIKALELGATDFLHKPVRSVELLPRVKNALVLKKYHDQMIAYSRRLEREVAERTAALSQAREEAIHVLACAAEYRDHETGNHVARVGRFCGIIAQELGLPDAEVDLIEQAAILHDTGKIGIADSVLLKPERLTEDEFALMKKHCEYGHRILKAMPADQWLDEGATPVSRHPRSPILEMAATIALTHHERWDGDGYPNQLAGEEIPIAGRITAVADVFDALSSKRCYKPPLPIERCVAAILDGRGTQFDPEVVDAFMQRIDDITRVVVTMCD